MKTRVSGRLVQVTYELVGAKDNRVKKLEVRKDGIEDLAHFMDEQAVTDRLNKMGVKILIGTEVIHITMDAPVSRTEANRLVQVIIDQAIGIKGRLSQPDEDKPTANKSQVPAGTSRTPRRPRMRDPRKKT